MRFSWRCLGRYGRVIHYLSATSTRKETREALRLAKSYPALPRLLCRLSSRDTSREDTVILNEHVEQSVSGRLSKEMEFDLDKLLQDIENQKALEVPQLEEVEDFNVEEDNVSAGGLIRTEKNRKMKQRRTETMNIDELVNILREESAEDLCVIKVAPEMGYVDHFVVCSGASSRHLLRMADRVAYEMKHVLTPQGGRVEVEGRDCEDWMALDLGHTAIHFMSYELRQKYELEKLWSLGPNYDDHLTQAIALMGIRET